MISSLIVCSNLPQDTIPITYIVSESLDGAQFKGPPESPAFYLNHLLNSILGHLFLL